MILRAFILTLTCLFTQTVVAEPTNLSRVINELKRYHDDGSYMQEFTNVVSQAEAILKVHLELNKSRHHPKKLALVFDIDETALSNYDDMVKLNFGGTLKSIDDNIAEGHATLLKPTLELFDLAKKKGIAIFFVTGRHPTIRESTIKNLENVGFRGWTAIYFKPNDYHQPSVVPYKTAARAEITKKGYEIVESIGDQWSDLAGGYADNTFKLPNPYYFLP